MQEKFKKLFPMGPDFKTESASDLCAIRTREDEQEDIMRQIEDGQADILPIKPDKPAHFCSATDVLLFAQQDLGQFDDQLKSQFVEWTYSRADAVKLEDVLASGTGASLD